MRVELLVLTFAFLFLFGCIGRDNVGGVGSNGGGAMVGAISFGNVNITMLGHSSALLESGGKTIYIDPYVLPANPKKADVILITHDHYDHCANVEKIRTANTKIITTSACANKIGGGAGVIVVREGDAKEVGFAKVEAVPAYNINKSFHPRGVGVGYIIEFGGVRIYHAGDTDFIPEMKNVRADIALLPVGGTYTMDASEATDAALALKPKLAIPMHYGKISGTGGMADAQKFKSEVESKSGGKIEVRVV
ncbi:MAG: MBL fold metallo-hydrolase [Candidatus Micrarchaeota archaeon]